MTLDNLHSVQRCKDGLSASETLSTTPGERAHWERLITYWREQLAHAERREETGK